MKILFVFIPLLIAGLFTPIFVNIYFSTSTGQYNGTSIKVYKKALSDKLGWDVLGFLPYLIIMAVLAILVTIFRGLLYGGDEEKPKSARQLRKEEEARAREQFEKDGQLTDLRVIHLPEIKEAHARQKHQLLNALRRQGVKNIPEQAIDLDSAKEIDKDPKHLMD